MTTNATESLHINTAKPAEIEFEVHTQGAPEDAPCDVRFIINDVDTGGSLLFDCEHTEGSHWCVKFPALKRLLTQPTYTFALEVIVDGYFFVAEEGTLSCVTEPTISMSQRSKKPKVKAAFNVKQDNSTNKKITEGALDEQAAQSSGSAFDHPVPSNHLQPEYEEATNSDEFDEISIPNADDSIEPEIEFTANDTPCEPVEFNPTAVAGNMVRSRLGNIKSSGSTGFLFKRSADGKPVVKGLETPDVIKRQQQNADLVKQILADE